MTLHIKLFLLAAAATTGQVLAAEKNQEHAPGRDSPALRGGGVEEDADMFAEHRPLFPTMFDANLLRSRPSPEKRGRFWVLVPESRNIECGVRNVVVASDHAEITRGDVMQGVQTDTHQEAYYDGEERKVREISHTYADVLVPSASERALLLARAQLAPGGNPAHEAVDVEVLCPDGRKFTLALRSGDSIEQVQGQIAGEILGDAARGAEIGDNYSLFSRRAADDDGEIDLLPTPNAVEADVGARLFDEAALGRELFLLESPEKAARAAFMRGNAHRVRVMVGIGGDGFAVTLVHGEPMVEMRRRIAEAVLGDAARHRELQNNFACFRAPDDDLAVYQDNDDIWPLSGSGDEARVVISPGDVRKPRFFILPSPDKAEEFRREQELD